MELKKLTADEILRIVESHYSVSSFAHGEWLDTDLEIPQEVQQKAEEVDKYREEFWRNIQEEISYPGLTYSELTNHPLVQQYESLPTGYNITGEYVLNTLGLGKVIEVDQYGGEGQGSTWYSVKHFVDHDVYIRTDGYYQSYEGTEFYDGYGKEVRPQQKTITVFE